MESDDSLSEQTSYVCCLYMDVSAPQLQLNSETKKVVSLQTDLAVEKKNANVSAEKADCNSEKVKGLQKEIEGNKQHSAYLSTKVHFQPLCKNICFLIKVFLTPSRNT